MSSTFQWKVEVFVDISTCLDDALRVGDDDIICYAWQEIGLLKRGLSFLFSDNGQYLPGSLR
jgi:hypothetical protein